MWPAGAAILLLAHTTVLAEHCSHSTMGATASVISLCNKKDLWGVSLGKLLVLVFFPHPREAENVTPENEHKRSHRREAKKQHLPVRVQRHLNAAYL